MTFDDLRPVVPPGGQYRLPSVVLMSQCVRNAELGARRVLL